MKLSVCIVVQNYYDTDPRVRREAEALLEVGLQVDVLALRPEGASRKSYSLNGIQVYTLPVTKMRGGKLRYITEYIYFFLLSFFWLTLRSLTRRYAAVQVCNLPDFLVFATLLPRLLGAKIILDMHEIMPEFYMSKFDVSPSHPIIRLLRAQERISIAYADHVITINDPMKATLLERGLTEAKSSILVNAVDEKLFQGFIHQAEATHPPFVFMYHGTLTSIYGLDIAIQALAAARDRLPRAEFWIIGDGPERGNLEKLCTDLGLEDAVKFIGVLPQQEIPQWLARCHAGVLPTRQDLFLDLSFSNKLPEYIIMGKPVIVSRLKTTRYYFTEQALMYFEPHNSQDLGEKMAAIYHDEELRRALSAQAFSEYAPHRWDIVKKTYQSLCLRTA
ncbi:MAG: glycosyltransferase family 4 protein [Chloroflexi bacterium]|nr:glycosyltransferase family 4 protein [Chloroflexota bacterium]